VSSLLTASLVGVELLKVRKRWLPYAVFLVMLAGVAVHIWLAGYGSWIDERNDAEYEFGRSSLRTFALPWSLPALLDTGQFYGSALVAILASSVVATEHNWGTVRQALIRGQTRAGYLTMKLAGITIVAGVSLLAALAVGLGFSAIATSLAGQPLTFDVPGGPSAFEAVLMVLRAGYCVLPYGMLAFALAVIGRSTALGVGGTLVYLFIIEAILIAVLGELGGPARDIRAFFLGHNVRALLAANTIGSAEYYSLAPREMAFSSDLPSPFVGWLVVTAYTLGLGGLAYWVFHRRDLGSDAGGG
jgi:ABC-type transport system involved in multi-copper enzyme maturation permease subunit